MKYLVSVALVMLIGMAVSTNVLSAVRDETPARSSTTLPGAPREPATSSSPADIAGSSETTTADTSTRPPVPGFSLAEVAAHDDSEDCWLAIDGSVYDVTTYLSSHPGGSRTIISWCGRESTEAFATEDGKGEHSEDAYGELANYWLGPLATG